MSVYKKNTAKFQAFFFGEKTANFMVIASPTTIRLPLIALRVSIMLQPVKRTI